MRVTLLTTFHERCGIATYAEGLTTGLRGTGIEVSVLAPRLIAGEPALGEQPPRLWRRNRAFGFEAFEVLREIGKLRPTLVHAQVNAGLFSSRFLFSLALGLKRRGIPLVATLHARAGGSLFRRFKAARMRFALRGADLVVHNDAHARELDRRRVHVIPHGVHVPSPRTMAEARLALSLEPDRDVLVHVGFLTPDKGIAEVMRAVATLEREPGRRLFYWISGAMQNTRVSRDCLVSLERLAHQLGIAERVCLRTQFVSDGDLETALQAASWIVLNYATGTHQATSGAVRRAIASGRPVAVTSAPIFDDLRSTVHTLGGGPLADQLRDLLDDDELSERLVRRGVIYREQHSWEVIAVRHAELYQRIVDRD